ncbi:MAG: hypothetical protein ACRDRY_24085 [Pseudonocardiaceae bacterium]
MDAFLARLVWLLVRAANVDQAQGLPVTPSAFEQYGPITIVAAVFASATWVMFRRYDQTLDLERARSKAAEAREQELHRSIREQIVPALLQSTASQNESAQALREVLQTLRKDR